jgi:hypothetical protein
MLQPEPFVVDIIRQPEVTPDISISVVVGMFEMAGVLLAAAAIGSVIAGGVLILIRRVRSHRSPSPEQSARRLRI